MARFFQSTTPFTWAFCVDFIRPALQVLGPPALAEVLASVLMGQLTLSSVLVSRGVSGLSTGTVLRKREGISAGGQPAHCGAQEEWLSALARRRPLGRLLATCAAKCELSWGPSLLPVLWVVGRMEPKRNCQRGNGSSPGGGAEAEGRVPATGRLTCVPGGTSLPSHLSRAGWTLITRRTAAT